MADRWPYEEPSSPCVLPGPPPQNGIPLMKMEVDFFICQQLSITGTYMSFVRGL